MINRWMRIDARTRVAILWTIILLQAVFSFWMYSLNVARDTRRAAYLRDHHCITDSFAGRNATRVYRCDTGLWLDNEIGQEVSHG